MQKNASTQNFRNRVSAMRCARDLENAGSIESALKTVNWFSEKPLITRGYYGGEYWVKCETLPRVRKHCFVFAGQGAAQPGMLRDQFHRPEIRGLFDRADDLAKGLGLSSISNHVLQKDPIEPAVFHQVQNLSLFTLEVALFDSLVSRGIIPRLITSHSFGEYAALVAAGVLSFEEMFPIVKFREEISPPANERGYLVAVNADRNEVMAILGEVGYHFSNFNSPTQTAISVAPCDVERVCERVKSHGKKVKVLSTPQPYHSPLLFDLKEKLHEFIKKYKMNVKAPLTPMFSSVLRQWITPDTINREMMVQIVENQMLEKVDFIRQIHEISEAGCQHFIEIGPKVLLSPFIKENAIQKGVMVNGVVELLGTVVRRAGGEEKLAKKSRVFIAVNEVIGKVTGYKIDEIHLEDRFQEDLGIDSIKKTEIMFSVMERLNIRPEGEIGLSGFDQVKNFVDFLETEVGKPKAIAADDDCRPANFRRYREAWRLKAITPDRMEAPVEKSPLVVPVSLRSLGNFKTGVKNQAEKILLRLRQSGSEEVVLVCPEAKFDVASIADGRLQKLLVGPGVKGIQLIREAVKAPLRLKKLRVAIVTRRTIHPLVAGYIALFKSLRKETPELFFKHIHLSDSANGAEEMRLVRAELRDPNDVEVKYEKGLRYVPELIERDAEKGGGGSGLGKDSVVVALGGAKGITFSLVREISRKYQPRLYLCGRSTEKEVLTALDELRKENKRVYYHSLDAIDKLAMDGYFRKIANKEGRIDLILNGVGVERSRSLVQKSDKEIEEELFGKVLSAIYAASGGLRNKARRLFFFSSVVGSYGNDGQTVYAFANGVLNQLATELNSHLAGRSVTAIAWPPWEGVGMTANQVVVQGLKLKGLSLLSPSRANELLSVEFSEGESHRSDVVHYFDRSDGLSYGFGLQDYGRFSCLIGKARVGRGQLGFERTFSLQSDPYLVDHQVGESSYLPGAVGASMFLCAAYLYFREWAILTNFEIITPIVIRKEDVRTTLSARLSGESLSMVLSSDYGKFTCQSVVEQRTRQSVELLGQPVLEIPASQIYSSKGLFHGPSFQCIEKIVVGSDGRLIGRINQCSLSPILGGGFWGAFSLWIDGAFQLLAFRELRESGTFCLPVKVGRLTSFAGTGVPKHLFVIPGERVMREDSVTTDVRIIDDRGETLVELDNVVLKNTQVKLEEKLKAGGE